MFYTDRLFIRTINSQTDAPVWTQWLNDPEYLAAISIGALRPTPTTLAHRMLEDFHKQCQDTKLPIFAVCDRPAPECDGEFSSHDDPFATADGKARHPMIGMLALRPGELGQRDRCATFGIMLDRKHTGRGLGGEALGWLCYYVFDVLGYHRLELCTAASNVRAIRCYETLGFVREGVIREAYFWEGQWRDLHAMAILEQDWRASRKGKASD